MASSGGGSGALAASEKPPVLRLKILSMGDSQSGKSCLIKRFCENKFTPKYMSTIGVDYGVKPVNVRGRDVRVNFFDLGGLDAYTDIRTEFYKDASGALVVFALDGRAGFERLDAWLAESRAAGAPPTLPLTLVGNKCECRHLVTSEEARRFAESRGMDYREVSACTGQDVAAMFEALFARAIDAVDAAAAGAGALASAPEK